MSHSASIDDAGIFINGRAQRGHGEKFETLHPATGKSICHIYGASKEDVEVAVANAREGFKKWSAMTGTASGRILSAASRLLREKKQELAQLEALDTGKPISETQSVDIDSAADAIEYFAGLAPTLHGEHFDLGGSFAYTRREPLGVVAGIGAWNYPLQIAAWKAAPALACGNSMVYKPSDMTPLTALRLAEIFCEAGLPPGVFNVVQGRGDIGEALSSHPAVAKVSVTGSVRTGQAVMAAAAPTLKHLTLELGGKSPLIIFADARRDQAVSAALLANFYSQGEICSNGTRVFVHADVYDAFLEQVVARAQAIRIGDPLVAETQMGALISQAHLDKVLGYIHLGQKEGARLLCGGKKPSWQKGSPLENGFFVEPTVFADCQDKMTIVREEIFGPVMSVLKFRDEDEVVERANATDYGLSAGVFTQEIQRAHRVVSRLEAGTCWINNYNITPIEVPFGGNKMSGIGRENSLAALNHYTQLKSVYVEMGDVQSPF
jgi:betaine-aldehyde dehydrogenase